MSAYEAESKAVEILRQHWNYRLPVDPVLIGTSLGLEMLESPSLEVDGAYIEENGRKAVIIRPSNSPLRDRFSIAHELGHACLGHGSSFRDPRVDYDITSFDPKERDANYFAAELLMPKLVLKLLILEKNITDPNRLSQIFGVSTKALEIKLKTAGLLK